MTPKKNAPHWYVTPVTGRQRRFFDTAKMVEFLKYNPGCIVSWIIDG